MDQSSDGSCVPMREWFLALAVRDTAVPRIAVRNLHQRIVAVIAAFRTVSWQRSF